MGLIDRLQNQSEEGFTSIEPSLIDGSMRKPLRSDSSSSELLAGLKLKVQQRLTERNDTSALQDNNPTLLLRQMTDAIREIILEEGLLLTEHDEARLVELTTNDMIGLGPLEPLLQSNDTADILVNGCSEVYVERMGKLHRTNVQFQSDQHLMQVINRIVARVGRRVDESSPMVDARLPDGSRVNAVIPPLTLDGPVLCIRRFGAQAADISRLVTLRSVSPEMAEFLQVAVATRLNILISGGTGTGKTTLLNSLSSFIPTNERIITIEDAAELSLQQPHVVRMETRPPNVEGKGEVTQRELFRNTLRMRPDRIIIGEVRGAEVLDMLQAMSTGHDGSMATIHANNPRDSLGRLQMMMLLSGVALPEQAMRQYIASALNLIVQVSRFNDGSRKVVKISEITGMEGNTVLMQDLFDYIRTGTDPAGKVIGHFISNGVRSIHAERFAAAGYGEPTAVP